MFTLVMTDSNSTRLDRLEALAESFMLAARENQRQIGQNQRQIEQNQRQIEQNQQQNQQQIEQTQRQIDQNQQQIEQTQRQIDQNQQQIEQTQQQINQNQQFMYQQQQEISQNSRDIRESMVDVIAMIATLGQQIEENSVYIRGLQAENRNILSVLMGQREEGDGD